MRVQELQRLLAALKDCRNDEYAATARDDHEVLSKKYTDQLARKESDSIDVFILDKALIQTWWQRLEFEPKELFRDYDIRLQGCILTLPELDDSSPNAARKNHQNSKRMTPARQKARLPDRPFATIPPGEEYELSQYHTHHFTPEGRELSLKHFVYIDMAYRWRASDLQAIDEAQSSASPPERGMRLIAGGVQTSVEGLITAAKVPEDADPCSIYVCDIGDRKLCWETIQRIANRVHEGHLDAVAMDLFFRYRLLDFVVNRMTRQHYSSVDSIKVLPATYASVSGSGSYILDSNAMQTAGLGSGVDRNSGLLRGIVIPVLKADFDWISIHIKPSSDGSPWECVVLVPSRRAAGGHQELLSQIESDLNRVLSPGAVISLRGLNGDQDVPILRPPEDVRSSDSGALICYAAARYELSSSAQHCFNHTTTHEDLLLMRYWLIAVLWGGIDGRLESALT